MATSINDRLGTANSSLRPTPVPTWDVKPSERAKELWGILRKSVKLSIDLVKKADVKAATIRHGVHHLRKINHEDALVDVIYNPTTEEFVTIDSQYIRVFYKDGRRKDIIDLGGVVTKLGLCVQSGNYIALSSPEEINLFNGEFELISVAKSQQKINCFIYNNSTNEVVTVGPGNLMTWCFRYGNRYLVPHRVVTAGLTCKDSFEQVVLERTESNTQRCFAVCGTAVAVFNLHQAKLLLYKKDLHVRNITSILFFNPLKYIVTGSRDGSIKLWDENFGIRLVFVGHHGPVSSLNLYPQGPYIMSASHDGSIRVWSMETCDEVDLIQMDEPVLGLGTTPHESSLYSYSKYSVDLWSITHVHQIFTTVGSPIVELKMTKHPKLVDRVVCQSEDGLVRLVSPVDGTVLTTLAAPRDIRPQPSSQRPESRQTPSRNSPRNSVPFVLVDAVYCLSLEIIMAVYADGSMVRANALTNPATIRHLWRFENGSKINCLCLYEYILDELDLKKSWDDTKAGTTLRQTTTTKPEYGNKVLLLAGCKDGSIANIDILNGKVLFRTDAHGAKGVIGLLANVKADQVISSGRDNVVKVWRMFPNTNEPLNLLMSFYCAHTPLYMTIIGKRVAIAFQQLASATYTIVMYDLETKERFDHSPEEDHTDELTGITCCPRLKLIASASRDGYIRVWSEDNTLVRVLKLNDEPQSVEFCDQRGNLLVGLGKNIHRIENTNYLPRLCLFKMVCMQFPEQIKEESFPYNESLLNKLDEKTLNKIKMAKSSFMTMDYDWDPMTQEEQEKIASEKREKLGAFAHLSARDSELVRIRDGSVKPKRANRKYGEKTRSNAFKKYMALFYDRPKKLKIPDQDDFDPDPPHMREQSPQEWIEEEKVGFFPPIKEARSLKHILEGDVEKKRHLTESGPDYETRNKYIINPSGFIPNSILIKLLWPQNQVKKLENAWKPPELTEEQQKMLAQMESSDTFGITPSDEGSIYEDRVFLMGSAATSVADDDFGSDEFEDGPQESTSDLRAGGKRQISFKDNARLENKRSSLMDKMRDAMKTPSPPPKEPTPPPTPPPPKVPTIREPRKPSKPLVRFVSRPPPPKAPTTPTSPTPPPPTPPPPTPPPKFLTQFEGLPWFEHHKAYIMERMQDSILVSKFFNIICDVLGMSQDWQHRADISDALLLLWRQEGMSNKRYVVSALNSVLGSNKAPNSKDSSQAAFLRASTKLYQGVDGGSDNFIIELLTQYVEDDGPHRSFVRNVLIEQGLQDPHHYLVKELDTWETWGMDQTKPLKPQIRAVAKKWYQDWHSRFQSHLDDTLHRLKQGDIHGRIHGGGLSKTAGGRRKVKLAVVDESASRSVSPIEVLNYFCEIRLEEELERVKLANMKPEPTKNTVLVLPKLDAKQAIVRLGDMHTARRARLRHDLAVEYKLNPLARPYPDLMASFANKLSLVATKVHMNPFPSEIDRFDEMTGLYQPILLTLRLPHRKYFVPERSYVHMA